MSPHWRPIQTYFLLKLCLNRNEISRNSLEDNDMTKCVVEKGVIIDDVESVLHQVRERSSKVITSIEVIKKFILREKNTHFYLDSNLNSYMQPISNCIYLWIDTGYVDSFGNPIFISLLKKEDSYEGHVVGTLKYLCHNAQQFLGINKSLTNKKIDVLRNKYDAKVSERVIRHIKEENEYLLIACSNEVTLSELATKLLTIDVPQDEQVVIQAEEEFMFEEKFTETEKEITMEILLNKMEEMEKYIDELLNIIETEEHKNRFQINELQRKNEEYKRAMVQMRDYVSENLQINSNASSPSEFNLIRNHKKILVVGGELGTNIMLGIAKSYGLAKSDLEFIEYDKAKTYTDRIRRDGKYSAVIFGSCPHKTVANAGYSSVIEKLKQLDSMPFVVDARTQSGKLKMTKDSFKRALQEICDNMQVAPAC